MKEYYGYQFDTNPKKIDTEINDDSIFNDPDTSDNLSKKSNHEKNHKIQDDQNKKVHVETKKSIKPRIKLVFYIAIGFSLLFAISYRNSLINESFSKKEEIKKELSAVEKSNEQLKVTIENTLNLNNIEQEAKERLGMQKLSNSQKIYINLPKRDYVEPATEEVIIDENTSILEKIKSLF